MSFIVLSFSFYLYHLVNLSQFNIDERAQNQILNMTGRCDCINSSDLMISIPGSEN